MEKFEFPQKLVEDLPLMIGKYGKIFINKDNSRQSRGADAAVVVMMITGGPRLI